MAKRPTQRPRHNSVTNRAKPDRTRPPNEVDLQSLPRSCQVAFATQCARRAQPVYKTELKSHGKHAIAILDAIELAMSSACAGGRLSIARHNEVAHRAVDAVHAARAASSFKAEAAARAAAYAVEAYSYSDTGYVAARAATQSAAAFDPDFEASLVAAMWADIDRLREVAKAGKWTDDTPVPASFFEEPLWPKGAPAGWPTQEPTPEATPTNRQNVPTEADLQSLPRWARVAFAARCARRVFAMFQATWAEAPAERVWELEGVIKETELSATTGPTPYDGTPVSRSRRGLRTLRVVIDEANRANASVALSVASSALNAVQVGDATANSSRAATAAANDSVSVVEGEEKVRKAIVSAIWHDFDLLRQMAVSGKWTDETPVPASFFDEPLWPTPPGPPKGWPAEPPAETNAPDPPVPDDIMEIQIALPAGASNEEIKRVVRELVEAASKHHHAHGGSGLVRAGDVKIYEVAGVPAGVLP